MIPEKTTGVFPEDIVTLLNLVANYLRDRGFSVKRPKCLELTVHRAWGYTRLRDEGGYWVLDTYLDGQDERDSFTIGEPLGKIEGCDLGIWVIKETVDHDYYFGSYELAHLDSISDKLFDLVAKAGESGEFDHKSEFSILMGLIMYKADCLRAKSIINGTGTPLAPPSHRIHNP